ncbi:hypothetical protein [Bosea sp. 124]|uniref:hypothetical protein n=1 Tax=Bosea sp. 124 TaxID=2135642 RepID=UPI0011B1CA2F|nr:hypothetical protein [Bosea sp. 124]
MTTSTNPAKESLRKEQQQQRQASRRQGKDAELTRALEDTFPASDPVAAEAPIKSGSSRKRH